MLFRSFKASVGYTPFTDLGAYLGTTLNRFSEAHIGNIQIAPNSSNGTILTKSGNLTLSTPSGSNVAITTTTTILGDLTLSGNAAVPGPGSGTLRANYLEVPNITPIGSVVLWAGRSDNLPSNPGVTMWAVCNGQTFNTYTYRTLHSIISKIGRAHV